VVPSDQAYELLIGVVPVQVPDDAVSVLPSCGVPLIVGRLVFDGAVGDVAVTTAVCGDDPDADPPELVAVTTDRIVWPTSVDPSW